MLVAEGKAVIYKYKKLNGEEVRGKYSILLVLENAKKERLMIVEIKGGKEMIVDKAEIKGEMAIYDEKNNRVVKF